MTKNDYEPEYKAARQRAETERYRQVRQEHPKVERKLAEIVRYRGGRYARYRRLVRVTIQYLLTGMVVNFEMFVYVVGDTGVGLLQSELGDTLGRTGPNLPEWAREPVVGVHELRAR